MKLIDFQRTIKYFNIDKRSLSVVFMADKVKKYELKFGGLKFSFVDDGKNNDVLVSGDMSNFKHMPLDNIFGINNNKSGIIHISTREGLLLVLITASHNTKKESGNYEEINAKISGEILAEVDPFISYEGLLRVAGNGINYTDQDLRDGLESFAKAVNPFAGKSADIVDATNLPLNVGVNGGRYENKEGKVVGTWLDITDLNSKNSTRYTCSEAGFSYRLNYITPDKSNRFEMIYNYAAQSRSEKVVIRKWLGKKTEKPVIKSGKKQDISDYFGTETKWDYSIDSELIYDIQTNSVNMLPIKLDSEEKTHSSITAKDLEQIYNALNQASILANEITSPVLPKNTRGRY